MGCDIHAFAEVRRNDKWERVTDAVFSPSDTYGVTSEPFSWRSYGMFAFLADVRNYSHVPAISSYRGLPMDSEYLNQPAKYSKGTLRDEELNEFDWHSHTWVLLKELVEFDYNKQFENRRYTKTEGNSSNGAAVAEEGQGEMVTYRDFLSNGYFEDLEVLKTLGKPEDVRVIMWFDN